jgi:hypothetical protein
MWSRRRDGRFRFGGESSQRADGFGALGNGFVLGEPLRRRDGGRIVRSAGFGKVISGTVGSVSGHTKGDNEKTVEAGRLNGTEKGNEMERSFDQAARAAGEGCPIEKREERRPDDLRPPKHHPSGSSDPGEALGFTASNHASGGGVFESARAWAGGADGDPRGSEEWRFCAVVDTAEAVDARDD